MNRAGFRHASIARDLLRLRRHARAGATVQEAAHSFAERSALLLLLFLGLLGFVPSPGLPLGAIAGLLVVSVCLGMLIQPRRLLLPRFLGRRKLPPHLLRRLLRFAVPFMRRLERRFRPRASWMTNGPGKAFAILAIALQGIGLMLPLPFGNLPFAFGIVLTALGLLTRDGLGTLAGHAVGLVSAVLFLGIGFGAVQAGTAFGQWLPW
ncbi:MAG TPA: exopolysaccharide biosynthesis protein [Ferrovibrio sp.]|jgi:hypothetical protein|uniref:exopolysaccharide biosynthesis protein n=1 Tax=Ferrovibrio sp. TaxID=1917215 RepID=UPI002ED2543B